MLRIHFTSEDLLRTTVSPRNPLWDVVLGFHRHRLDRRHPAVAVLLALSPAPDLLTPDEGTAGLDEGLQALQRTPPARIRAELARLGPLPSWTAPLARGEQQAVDRLAAMLRFLHNALVAPHASAIGESVTADRARRARDLVDGGVHGLLANLGPYACWDQPVLSVEHPESRDLHLNGRGLRLVPSFFCRRPRTLTDPDLPPVLVHPISTADRWVGAAPGGLNALLGPTRSAVLLSARSSASTTELARRVGTSPASVSRHTGVLRAAGLLRTARQGARTVHSLTRLGESLVGGRAADRAP